MDPFLETKKNYLYFYIYINLPSIIHIFALLDVNVEKNWLEYLSIC